MEDERVRIREEYMKDKVKNSKPKKFLYSENEVKAENCRRVQLPRSRWIETTFEKRECGRFIKNPKDELRCCCGRLNKYHISSQIEKPLNEEWLPSRHTNVSPTNAYGTIEFQGGPHPKKAQYVRVSYDTPSELLFQLFTREWKLQPPRFVITIRGGKANFELQPKLKKALSEGLLKAAKTTGVWILTDGLHTGVTKQVGDVLSERSGSRVFSLGISPWGIIENSRDLIGLNQDVSYHSISSPRSRFIALNSKHAFFILVDNGTHGKYGAEIILRRKLEKFISTQSLYPYTHNSTPVVCLVIEGGPNTIRAVLEYVTDSPPVPVVVCDGSGRAADLIALAYKYSDFESDAPTKLETKKTSFITKIQDTFEVDIEQAQCLYEEILKCMKKKNLITIFKVLENCESDTPEELDEIILTALFTSQHLPPSEQLGLALAWNRVDIAENEIFIYGQEWPPNALDEAMMQALEHDRTDFVKLLLQNGVDMKKFLTIPRLENLYNTKQGPSNTLEFILKDVVLSTPKDYIYTLYDIGLVINKLMGGAYRALYSRRKFKPIYDAAMNNACYTDQYLNIKHESIPMNLSSGLFPSNDAMYLFNFPFNELLMWAVLMKRQNMAILMWEHGEEALAKALVASKLYKSMAHVAAHDDMEIEVCEELRNYGKDFGNIALELLDFSYRQDDDQTLQSLICELPNWSWQTCLSLAVSSNHHDLLAHPCSQIILVDLWMGGLRSRYNTNFKLITGLLCPPFILFLEFKSMEELELMRQDKKTETKKDDYNFSSFKYNVDAKPDFPLIFENDSATKQDTNYPTLGFSFDDPQKDLKVEPLNIQNKLYEFYTAPIIKFWAHFISYIIFLIIFSYVILVRMGPTPSWQEYIAISFIIAMGLEKVRDIISTEPIQISQKYAIWKLNIWNPSDAIAVIFFFIGLCLRLQKETLSVGRVIYCVDSIYWYLRILNIIVVNKYFGPLVTMMGKMVINMMHFVVLLLVVLMSFGVCRHAILYPDKEPSWKLARDAFYEPYFMMYGELFSDGIHPDCKEEDGECVTGRWITLVSMSIYLLIANILLVNLLIAVFNNIFTEVSAIAQQLWMFQRYSVVLEYEQKAILPPPFSIICHILLITKYLKQELKGKREYFGTGLKLFLEKNDMEKLYDFEEECMEGYFAEQELILQQSIEERVKLNTDKIENMLQKVNGINCQISCIQNIETRLKKLENSCEAILSQLANIHRLVESCILKPSLSTTSLEIEENKLDRPLLRLRPKGKLLKSLTEVRPDSYSFDDDFNGRKMQAIKTAKHKKQIDAALDSVLHIENKLLMDAEKNDYMLMEKLIEKRCSEDNQMSSDPSLLEIDVETQGFVNNSPPAGALRRQEAVKEDD